MNKSASDIINSTGGFISSANSWQSSEFVVFFTILFMALVLIIFYFSQRNSSQMANKLLEVQKDSNSVINNNTNAIGSLSTLTKENAMYTLDKQKETHAMSEKNFSKLENIQNGVDEIKSDVRSLKYICENRKGYPERKEDD